MWLMEKKDETSLELYLFGLFLFYPVYISTIFRRIFLAPTDIS